MTRISIIMLFILFGCSSSPVPKNFLQPNDMKHVMMDMIKADEYINAILIRDSTIDLVKRRSVLYEQIFRLHKTTHKDFYASYDFYQQHPDQNKILYDSLLKYGDRMKQMHEGQAIDTLNK